MLRPDCISVLWPIHCCCHISTRTHQETR